MASAQTSFDRAENACLVFLGGVLGVPAGDDKDISRDDWISPDLVNKYAFSISGGPEQSQNFCIAGPGPAWFAYAQLLGQFEKRADAIAALGKIQNKFPARKASACGGLVPNVTNFEILEHPEIYTQLILSENNTVSNRIFVLRVRFRVIYNNTMD